jgi:hypothetical protein
MTAANRSATKNGKTTRKRHAGEYLATDHRSLYTGLIRLHVLHHAVEEPVYGFAMIEELRRHGYELSSGTLYPILPGLEKRGLLAAAVIGLTPVPVTETTGSWVGCCNGM